MMNVLKTGILIFDEVEVLDFAGPFEVFSRARLQPGVESRRSDDSAPFNVFTVAKTTEPIRAVGGLVVTPKFGFADCPALDLLLVPGGWGTRRLLEDKETLTWIQNVADSHAKMTSVCTGSLLLAKLKLLRDKKATTHWSALDLLTAIDPTIAVVRGIRYVDDTIITSAGVSAGIDMALYVVESMFGADVARDTARYMEYQTS
jgi:transcriptional regulator GlxA family with amidase domain